MTRPEERPGNGALRERPATVRLPGSCSRRISLLRLRAASVSKLDRSDAGGFPGETGAGVQLPPHRDLARRQAGLQHGSGRRPAPLQGPRGPDGVAGHERADSLPAWRLDPGTVGSTEGGRERGLQPKQIDRSGECVRVCFSLPPSHLGCLIDRSYVSAGGNWSFLPALEKNRFRLVRLYSKCRRLESPPFHPIVNR